jgi:hypothetical protein
LLGFTLLPEDTRVAIILLRLLPLLLPLTTISKLFTADLVATLIAVVLNIHGIPANALLSVRLRFLYSEPPRYNCNISFYTLSVAYLFEGGANFPN